MNSIQIIQLKLLGWVGVGWGGGKEEANEACWAMAAERFRKVYPKPKPVHITCKQ